MLKGREEKPRHSRGSPALPSASQGSQPRDSGPSRKALPVWMVSFARAERLLFPHRPVLEMPGSEGLSAARTATENTEGSLQHCGRIVSYRLQGCPRALRLLVRDGDQSTAISPHHTGNMGPDAIILRDLYGRLILVRLWVSGVHSFHS